MDYSIPVNKDASIDYQLQEIKGSFSFDESPFACPFYLSQCSLTHANLKS